MRDCVRQLKHIGTDADKKYYQEANFLIDGIMVKNYGMEIGKVSVINNKSNFGMATNFEKYVSYLKKCVATTMNKELTYTMLVYT